MRARERGAIAVATAALLLGATASCADDDGRDPKASTPATTTRMSTPPSDSDNASEAASAAVRKYYVVRNQLRQDPDQSLSRLDSVAISTELAAEQNLFKKERQKGFHQVGETKIAQLEVQSVNLDNSDPKAGKVPTVQVDLCFDVSDVDVVDTDGESVTRSDRPDTGWIQFLVSNYQWDDDPDGGWRVASSQDLERTRCDAL